MKMLKSPPPPPPTINIPSEIEWRASLAEIADRDVRTVVAKNAEYGGSWKARGGCGAFMVTARKWDRLENQLKKNGYDVFQAALSDQRPEGILDDLNDLAQYLLLIRAEIKALKNKSK